MGRFFQAPTTSFVDDFLYKAPYELAMQVMAKKNQDIETNVDTMELLRDLPIDRLDYHRDAVNNIQSEIGGKVDSLAKNLSKDMLNSNNKYEIRKLKRELKQRFDNGDIYNIQQSSKNYKEFIAKVDADKTINSADKELYKKGYWDNYVQQNPEGGYGNVFEPGQLMRSVDPLKEFAEWWGKYGGTESVNNVFDVVNGRYVMKNTDNRTSKIVGDNFKKFIQSSPEYEQIFRHRQDAGFFGETYFDENGQLDLNSENGILSRQNDLAQSMNTTSVTTGRELTPDQYALTGYKHALSLAEMKAKAALDSSGSGSGSNGATPPVVGTRVNKLLSNNVALQEALSKQVSPILKKMRALYAGDARQTVDKDGKTTTHVLSNHPYNKALNFDAMSIPSQYQLIKEILSDDGKQKYGAIYDSVKVAYDHLNENMKASNELVAPVWGSTNTAAFIKSINNATTIDTKFSMGMSEDNSGPGYDGETTNDITIKDIHKNGINGTKVKPSATKLLQDKTVLVPISTGDIKDDMVMLTYQFQSSPSEEGEVPEVFEVPMYVPLRNYAQMPTDVDSFELSKRQ